MLLSLRQVVDSVYNVFPDFYLDDQEDQDPKPLKSSVTSASDAPQTEHSVATAKSLTVRQAIDRFIIVDVNNVFPPSAHRPLPRSSRKYDNANHSPTSQHPSILLLSKRPLSHPSSPPTHRACRPTEESSPKPLICDSPPSSSPQPHGSSSQRCQLMYAHHLSWYLFLYGVLLHLQTQLEEVRQRLEIATITPLPFLSKFLEIVNPDIENLERVEKELVLQVKCLLRLLNEHTDRWIGWTDRWTLKRRVDDKRRIQTAIAKNQRSPLRNEIF